MNEETMMRGAVALILIAIAATLAGAYCAIN